MLSFPVFPVSYTHLYDTAGVAEMVQAGNCWITPGSLDDTYTGQIVEGVKEGRITLERLEENLSLIHICYHKLVIFVADSDSYQSKGIFVRKRESVIWAFIPACPFSDILRGSFRCICGRWN